MKFGFICSGGGSILCFALDILFDLGIINKSSVKILVDRNCDAEIKAKNMDVKNKKIIESDKRIFSIKSSKYFSDCDSVLLFFNRLVSEELYLSLPVFNIHPSYLPAFKGFKAIENAYKMGVNFLGATLHLVDNTIDGGEIVAQKKDVLPKFSTIDYYRQLSFTQCMYLTLLYIEILSLGKLNLSTQKVSWNEFPQFDDYDNPLLSDIRLMTAFKKKFDEILCKEVKL